MHFVTQGDKYTIEMDVANEISEVDILPTYELSMALLLIRKLTAESLRSVARMMNNLAENLDKSGSELKKTWCLLL